MGYAAKAIRVLELTRTYSFTIRASEGVQVEDEVHGGDFARHRKDLVFQAQVSTLERLHQWRRRANSRHVGCFMWSFGSLPPAYIQWHHRRWAATARLASAAFWRPSCVQGEPRARNYETPPATTSAQSGPPKEPNLGFGCRNLPAFCLPGSTSTARAWRWLSLCGAAAISLC